MREVKKMRNNQNLLRQDLNSIGTAPTLSKQSWVDVVQKKEIVLIVYIDGLVRFFVNRLATGSMDVLSNVFTLIIVHFIFCWQYWTRSLCCLENGEPESPTRITHGS